ncbi:MAG: hypothetical protein HC899_04605 [Leptolyngbyaceae cyanobacterium SM1_4_3]|nr:hypothetical protein [Leptolyngbyaceae cyanobacterium SM1_4_3]
MKLKLYPAIIGVLGIGIIFLLIGRFDISIWMEPIPSEETGLDAPPPSSEAVPREVPSPSFTPAPVAVSPAAPAASVGPSEENSAIAQLGNLRVSNQTSHPVRVALLAQSPVTTSASEGSSTEGTDTYSEPVHWDFAPGEGSASGLLLSLPEGELQLQQGDILVVFAQDGSRQYWGPYVVGKTVRPIWSSGTEEWQLIVQ